METFPFLAGEGNAFFNELRVVQSCQALTLPCAVGTSHRLQDGMQELATPSHGSAQNDPKAVQEDRRTKLVFKDEKVRIGRFGGEGTGGQSFFDLRLESGETYRFLVTSKSTATAPSIAGFFRGPTNERVEAPGDVLHHHRRQEPPRLLLVRRGLQARLRLGDPGSQSVFRRSVDAFSKGRMDCTSAKTTADASTLMPAKIAWVCSAPGGNTANTNASCRL